MLLLCYLNEDIFNIFIGENEKWYKEECRSQPVQTLKIVICLMKITLNENIHLL